MVPLSWQIVKTGESTINNNAKSMYGAKIVKVKSKGPCWICCGQFLHVDLTVSENAVSLCPPIHFLFSHISSQPIWRRHGEKWNSRWIFCVVLLYLCGLLPRSPDGLKIMTKCETERHNLTHVIYIILKTPHKKRLSCRMVGCWWMKHDY